jgi:hypothetical protein
MGRHTADRGGLARQARSSPWWFAWRKDRNWGYRRNVGALSNLGHRIARGTVANILKKNGIEPAPERERKTTWTSCSAIGI